MFRFSLETLLKFRRLQEDACARELRIASDELRDAEYQLARLQQSQQEHERQWLAIEQQGISSVEISLHRQYALHLDQNMRAQNIQVAEIKAKVEVKRRELIEKMKQRRLLERLKEKKFQEYLVAEYRTERKQIDELAVSHTFSRSEN